MADTPTEPPGVFERALHEVAERRARRRRLLAAVGLPLALAAAVSAWVWKPWQSVELPAAACWSTVTAADLEPLAGDDGTAHVDQSGDLSGKPAGRCVVYWNDAKGRPLVSVTVRQTDEGGYGYLQHQAETPDLAGHPRPLQLGAGAAGVITSDANVSLVYRCSAGDPGGTGGQPFRQVLVSGGPVTGDDRGTAVREAHVRLAWLVAVTAAGREGCPGAALVAAPPTVPAK
ncbi:hypothetical protein [Kitasatospora sp. NPDC093806]|uniref:hypothetical protein n=1 Tax=Kitasatospora sp. NPDC093806 TaxID=3155075 RepID=UPI00344473D9